MNTKCEFYFRQFLSNCNRIAKLSKYIKSDLHDFDQYETKQEKEIAAASLLSKIEQVKMLCEDSEKLFKNIQQHEEI